MEQKPKWLSSVVLSGIEVQEMTSAEGRKSEEMGRVGEWVEIRARGFCSRTSSSITGWWSLAEYKYNYCVIIEYKYNVPFNYLTFYISSS